MYKVFWSRVQRRGHKYFWIVSWTGYLQIRKYVMGRFKRQIKLTIAKEGSNGKGTIEIVTKTTMMVVLKYGPKDWAWPIDRGSLILFENFKSYLLFSCVRYLYALTYQHVQNILEHKRPKTVISLIAETLKFSSCRNSNP